MVPVKGWFGYLSSDGGSMPPLLGLTRAGVSFHWCV
jgi:hypothetical protein